MCISLGLFFFLVRFSTVFVIEIRSDLISVKIVDCMSYTPCAFCNRQMSSVSSAALNRAGGLTATLDVKML